MTSSACPEGPEQSMSVRAAPRRRCALPEALPPPARGLAAHHSCVALSAVSRDSMVSGVSLWAIFDVPTAPAIVSTL